MCFLPAGLGEDAVLGPPPTSPGYRRRFNAPGGPGGPPGEMSSQGSARAAWYRANRSDSRPPFGPMGPMGPRSTPASPKKLAGSWDAGPNVNYFFSNLPVNADPYAPPPPRPRRASRGDLDIDGDAVEVDADDEASDAPAPSMPIPEVFVEEAQEDEDDVEEAVHYPSSPKEIRRTASPYAFKERHYLDEWSYKPYTSSSRGPSRGPSPRGARVPSRGPSPRVPPRGYSRSPLPASVAPSAPREPSPMYVPSGHGHVEYLGGGGEPETDYHIESERRDRRQGDYRHDGDRRQGEYLHEGDRRQGDYRHDSDRRQGDYLHDSDRRQGDYSDRRPSDYLLDSERRQSDYSDRRQSDYLLDSSDRRQADYLLDSSDRMQSDYHLDSERRQSEYHMDSSDRMQSDYHMESSDSDRRQADFLLEREGERERERERDHRQGDYRRTQLGGLAGVSPAPPFHAHRPNRSAFAAVKSFDGVIGRRRGYEDADEQGGDEDCEGADVTHHQTLSLSLSPPRRRRRMPALHPSG